MATRVPPFLRIICWSVCILSLSAAVHVIAAEQQFVAADAVPPLRVARYGHTATGLADGRVLVAGGTDGTDGTGARTSVEIYDPAHNAWTEGAAMPTPHSGHSATLLSDGRLLVAGGSTDEGKPAGAEIYDPLTNTWSTAGVMSIKRWGHAAVRLADGTVLVTGGQTSNAEGQAAYLAEAETYDPATNSWEPVAAMASSRAHHTASLLWNGRVLVAGGSDSAGRVAIAELFDPDSKTWEDAGAPGHFHVRHTATVLEDGRVLLAGGTAGLQTDIYDVRDNLWAGGPSLNTPREDASATLLGDGRVLLAGGYDADWTAATELYSVEANGWTTTAPLAMRRSNHTATLLSSGGVLVVGGYDGTNTIGTAEIWLVKPADKTPPTISITAPCVDGVYAIGERVAAAYSCEDDTEVASCAGSTPAGAAIETAEAGSKTFEVTATDAAGHTTVKAVTYKVVAPTNTKISAASPASATYGQRVTLTAVVESDGAGRTPAGAVEFFDNDVSLGTPSTLVNGRASLETTAIGVGNRLTAVYRPDGLYAPSTSLVFQYPVTKAAATSTLMFSKSPQQYSDLETFEATVSSAVLGQPAASVTFKVGTLEVGTADLLREGAVYKARLTVTLVEPATGPTGQMAPTPPMGRLATAVMNGALNFAVPNAARALVITKEDGRAAYDGTLLAWTTGTQATDAATVTLRAIIKDITAAEPGLDASPGDIRKAFVAFYNRETGIAVSPPLPVTLLREDDTSTGFVTYDWAPAIGAANSQTFRIGIQLGTNYIRNSQTEDALVTVSKSLSPRFITGGGSLTMAASRGLKAGNAGSANGFGLGVKYSGTGFSPAGQFHTMVRSGANVYHVKSMTLTSLMVAGNTAVLKGTANIYDITYGSALLDSRATFEVTLTDNGPGSSDTIAIVVRNGAGALWFSSTAQGVQQVLSSGDVTGR